MIDGIIRQAGGDAFVAGLPLSGTHATAPDNALECSLRPGSLSRAGHTPAHVTRPDA